MRTAMLLLTALLCAGQATAALVDIDYAKVRHLTIAKTLAGILASAPTETPDADAFNPASSLSRVVITWDGAKAPPSLRYEGVPVAELVRRLAALGEPTASPQGPAYALPGVAGYSLLALGESEAAVLPTRLLATVTPPEWPAERSAHAVSFSGVSGDLKIGDASDRVRSFDLAWNMPGDVVVRVQATSNDAARSLLRWLGASRPLISIAAGFGSTRADFASDLLAVTTINRKGSLVTAVAKLEGKVLAQVESELLRAITKQMRRYR